jgi:hypothetical protein
LTRTYLIRKIGTPPPPLKLILADQDAYDIISRMMLKHKTCACDYSKIASDFEGRTVYEVAENLFNFCKSNIQYREEKIAKQYISSPQTILSRGYCDCKGYALFCGGVLDALNRRGWNIKWVYRFASDDTENEIPGHVFVVITDGGHEIWLDPVLNYFNQDHYYPHFQDKKISVSRAIAGCDCAGIGTVGVAPSSPSGSSIAFWPVPPPAGSKVIANIPGWPTGMPNLVFTPDGRLTFAFLPATRVPTATDLQYVLSSIQAVFNTYLNQPFNVFTYENGNGQTFAAVIKRILGQPYGQKQTLFNKLTMGSANNLFDIPFQLENQNFGDQTALGSAIMKVFSYVPVIGILATGLNAIVTAENASADTSQAAQTAALLKSVSPGAAAATGLALDQNGNVTGEVAGNSDFILIAAAAAIALILIM